MGENGENAVVNGEGAQQQPDTTVQQQQTDPTTNATNNTSASGTIAGNGSNGQGTQQQPGTVNYDFVGVEMPEGYELSADEQGRFVDVYKGMNLSNAQARALA